MKVLRSWLPLAAVLTLVTGMIYASVQQTYRSGADDPQIQMAEDAAARLDAGANPEEVIQGTMVEMSTSLAPFLMVFDEAGEPVARDVSLHGNVTRPPIGVLDAARQNGQNRVTWQPEAGVRIASVVVAYDGGTVLAGRSLREAEARVGRLTTMLEIGWLVSLVISLVVVWGSQAVFKE